MGIKTSNKAYVTNLVYGLGAAVVIIGALMKITHFEVGPLTGNLMLSVGLITEALIFIYSAFFDAPAGEYEWEKAYPELLDGETVERKSVNKESQLIKETEISLSSKLDDMLKQAKLDVNLFERLKTGIENFGSSVENINKVTDASSATQKYGDQLALAASHMESLNALYQVQLDNGRKQIELNTRLVEDLSKSASQSTEFANQMGALTTNLSNLNKVYGGMLGAMKI